ncbi:MAG: hypothetical protein ACJARG_001739 [Arcticibacterium sp.]|jgi:hypothetical protein
MVQVYHLPEPISFNGALELRNKPFVKELFHSSFQTTIISAQIKHNVLYISGHQYRSQAT